MELLRLVVWVSIRSARTAGEGGSGIERDNERAVCGVRVVGGSGSELEDMLLEGPTGQPSQQIASSETARARTYARFDARWTRDSQELFDVLACLCLSPYSWLPDIITGCKCTDTLAFDRRRRNPLEEGLQRGIVG